MVVRSGYIDGEPCWADVVAPDLPAAQHFYAALFGWTYVDTGADFGNYVMCCKDDRIVAGMSPPMPGSEQLPAAWSLYLMSHDLADTARRIDEHGGKLLVAPMEIPHNGRMLFATDPSGAAFGAWEPGRHTGSQLFDENGALCWAEVNTREPTVTDFFYHGLFGYRQTRINGGGKRFDYSAWSLGDADPVAGRLTMTEAWEGVPPHWMVYFATDDTDRAVARIAAAGGEVQHGPFDSPHGRIAVVVDPNGAVFTLISR
ncbi:VOC family protein [Dactylosporangium fulvum]|uniref:VOC family protein n=1 Tax=Dactylosporangium fulvum TaxID=53359 RepID=A0ABY5VUJ4_9ACTN|nr:VOC family protein [Dactylosporangium fulvum]UWP81437.1 VOC family protein [Dactylosporangium fulvum]